MLESGLQAFLGNTNLLPREQFLMDDSGMDDEDLRNDTYSVALSAGSPAELDCSLTSPANESSVAAFINHTDPEYWNYRYSYITILLTLAFFGIVLNTLLVGHMLRRIVKNNQIFALSFLILQLSIANLMVAVFCLMADGIWNITVQWYGGDLLCRLIKYLQMLSLYAATLLLTGMSVEACVTVTFPLTKSYRPDTLLRARVASIFCWSLAALCSIPQAVIFHTEKAPICEEFYQCVTHGFYVSSTQELAYTMATLCLMCVVPLFIIIVCYIVIFVKMSNEAQIASGNASTALLCNSTNGQLKGSNNTQGIKIYIRTRQQFLWMTFLTALTFVICWVPYYFAMFGHLFQWTISHETLSAIFCFGMSSSVINPVIFGGFLLRRNESDKEETAVQLQRARRGYSFTTNSGSEENGTPVRSCTSRTGGLPSPGLFTGKGKRRFAI